jgi:hypothetical protein
MDLFGESLPVWMVEEPASLFAMAGILHPQLLVSRQVMDVLPGDQLVAAVRHERAHWLSHDNLKRLVLAVAPDMLPFISGFRTLERSWAKYIERAADDRAVAGDPGCSLSLAEALVRVSRLGIAPRAPSLIAPLLADDGDLPARVQRLLSAAPPGGAGERWLGGLVAGPMILFGALVTIWLQPASLYPVHWLLEHLIR